MDKYIHFDEIDSTSTYLKHNYKDYDTFTFVSANYQSDGHGRNNRNWYGQKGKDLLFSFLIKDKEIIENYAKLSLICAKTIMELLLEFGIKEISYKWPNDVYVNGKKICGILLEGVSYSNNIEAIIIGIGINVNSFDFPSGIEDIATSIKMETMKEYNLEEIKLKAYKILKTNILNFKDSEYITYLRENNYLINKDVYAFYKNKKELVKVLDINNDNSLKVEMNGDILNIYSGEITFNDD